MASKDILMFCPNELPVNTLAAFLEMRDRAELCDVTIKVQNICIPAHRAFLAAVIPYFRRMFLSGMSEIQESEVSLENFNPTAARSLINFAYTGKIEISSSNAVSLLVASDYLELVQVRNACGAFLSENLRPDNVITVLFTAESIHYKELVDFCVLYIRNSFHKFSKHDDFTDLPYEYIKKAISSHILNACNEKIVFESVIKWVECLPTERLIVLPELLSMVRMVHLPNEYLVNCVSSQGLITSSVSCRELVEEVKHYQSLPKKKFKLSGLKTLPRNFGKYILYALSVKDGWNNVFLLEGNQSQMVNKKWHYLSADFVTHYYFINHAVVVKEKIYIFSNCRIYTYDIKSHKWEQWYGNIGDDDFPEDGFSQAAVVALGDVIYCFVPNCACDDPNLKGKLYCIDTKLNYLMDSRSLNHSLFCSGATSVDEDIYVIGGCSCTHGKDVAGCCQASSKRYTPSNNQWKEVAPMPTPRFGHKCTSMNGKIYVCGGKKHAPGNLMYAGSVDDTVLMYDTREDQWNFISPIPLTSSDVRINSLISYNNKIYASKGVIQDCLTQSIVIYDPESGEWTTGYAPAKEEDDVFYCRHVPQWEIFLTTYVHS